jgi:hypothetical protein
VDDDGVTVESWRVTVAQKGGDTLLTWVQAPQMTWVQLRAMYPVLKLLSVCVHWVGSVFATVHATRTDSVCLESFTPLNVTSLTTP